MNMITHEVKIDFSLPTAYRRVYSYRYDSGSRMIKFILTDNKEPYMIPDGAVVYIYGDIDGEEVKFTRGNFSDNTVSVPITELMSSQSAVNCKLKIVDTDHSVVTTPQVTIFNMDPLDLDGNIKASSEYTALISAIIEAEGAKIVSVKTLENDIVLRYADGTEVTIPLSENVGVSIDTIEREYTVTDGKGVTTIRIILTDGREFEFDISDGNVISPAIKNGNWWIGENDTGVRAEGTDGVDGDDGRGITSITRTSGSGAAGTTDTYTIKYTDNTTSTFTVVNGKNGSDGKDGTNGSDGTSVTVTNVSTSTADGGNNVVTFSDGKTLTVKNGSKGSKGDKGDTGTAGTNGTNGKDGTSVTVTNVSTSTADGGSNVVTFSDGKTLTVKNGSKGSTGAAGKDGATAAQVIAAMATETWTFTLADGSTVTKVVPLV